MAPGQTCAVGTQQVTDGDLIPHRDYTCILQVRETDNKINQENLELEILRECHKERKIREGAEEGALQFNRVIKEALREKWLKQNERWGRRQRKFWTN